MSQKSNETRAPTNQNENALAGPSLKDLTLKELQSRLNAYRASLRDVQLKIHATAAGRKTRSIASQKEQYENDYNRIANHIRRIEAEINRRERSDHPSTGERSDSTSDEEDSTEGVSPTGISPPAPPSNATDEKMRTPELTTPPTSSTLQSRKKLEFFEQRDSPPQPQAQETPVAQHTPESANRSFFRDALQSLQNLTGEASPRKLAGVTIASTLAVAALAYYGFPGAAPRLFLNTPAYVAGLVRGFGTSGSAEPSASEPVISVQRFEEMIRPTPQPASTSELYDRIPAFLKIVGPSVANSAWSITKTVGAASAPVIRETFEKTAEVINNADLWSWSLEVRSLIFDRQNQPLTAVASVGKSIYQWWQDLQGS